MGEARRGGAGIWALFVTVHRNTLPLHDMKNQIKDEPNAGQSWSLLTGCRKGKSLREMGGGGGEAAVGGAA